MVKILPAKYRYPVFFVGIFMMSIAGFVQKYARTGLEVTVALVAVGFVLFLTSIALP